MKPRTAFATEPTTEELLEIIDRKMRDPRTNAAQLLRLSTKRDRLVKSMMEKKISLLDGFTEPQQRALGRMPGDKSDTWKTVYRIENEEQLKKQRNGSSPSIPLST